MNVAVDILEPFLSVAALLWGLLWGSFANVLIHRVPRGENIATPASHCPACGETLSWFENLPLLSYLLLRGRCRHCDARISLRYWLVELATGVLMLLLWLHVTAGPRGDAYWEQAALVFVLQSYFLVGLIALTAIDMERQLLPHRITIPLLLLGIFSAWVLPADGVWASYFPAPDVADAIVGALSGMFLIWSVFHIFLRLTGKIGIGGGDMMLLGVLGAWFGWMALPIVLLLASLQGIVVVALSLVFPIFDGSRDAVERASEPVGEAFTTASQGGDDGGVEGASVSGSPDELDASGIAFGPFLVLAAIEYLFFGSSLLYWVTGGAFGG